MMLVFEPDSLKKYKNLLHIFGALDITPSGVISSVGRALRLHRRCREFESLITHHNNLSRQELTATEYSCKKTCTLKAQKRKYLSIF